MYCPKYIYFVILLELWLVVMETIDTVYIDDRLDRYAACILLYGDGDGKVMRWFSCANRFDG